MAADLNGLTLSVVVHDAVPTTPASLAAKNTPEKTLQILWVEAVQANVGQSGHRHHTVVVE